jgi:predicted NAD-dependent protein-ADP-ribosyltransferase YbiA (DUF1768 family)
MPGRISSFRGDEAFLSNFFESPIKFEGDVYPTIEHVFQAAKTFDAAEGASVRDAKTPGSAKKIGRRVKLRPYRETVLLMQVRDRVGGVSGDDIPTPGGNDG